MAASEGEGAALRAFGGFLRAVEAPGALDERTKELLMFTLLVYSRCEACIDDHFERARSLGLTDKELDEAAWCAIVVGGAPVFTFWKQARERAGGAGQGR